MNVISERGFETSLKKKENLFRKTSNYAKVERLEPQTLMPHRPLSPIVSSRPVLSPASPPASPHLHLTSCLLPFPDLIDNVHNFLKPGLIHKAIAFLGTYGENHRHMRLPPAWDPSATLPRLPRPLLRESPSSNEPVSHPQSLRTPRSPRQIPPPPGERSMGVRGA